MQKKLSLFRIAALLALSAALLVLPAGAFLGNSAMAASVHAGEAVSGDESATAGGDVSASTPVPAPGCVCDSRCGQFDRRIDCPVCGVDYGQCAYRAGWFLICLAEWLFHILILQKRA